MTEECVAPDVSALDVPMDIWTQPFWEGAAAGELLLPRCGSCLRFRWPPGPFCPHCQSQAVDWCPPGIARIYSYTIVRKQPSDTDAGVQAQVPALIEFPESDGVRLVAAIVSTRLDKIQVGAHVDVTWLQAVNAQVPMFKVNASD
jgi:uncharacterized OB-fold protein